MFPAARGRKEQIKDNHDLIFVRQANVNPKADLTDDFKEKRKAVHIGSCKLMCGDLKATAEREAAAMKVIHRDES